MSLPAPTKTPPHPASPTGSPEASAEKTHPLLQRLDEAFHMLEWRRYRRILQSARLPVLFSAGVLLITFWLIPFFAGTLGMGSSRLMLQQRVWPIGTLFVASSLAAALVGFLRAQHLWNQEYERHSLELLLLTHQQARRVVWTMGVMSAGLGLLLIAFPLLVGAIGLPLLLFNEFQWWQLPLTTVLLCVCALTGAAAGASTFFINYNLVPPRLLAVGGGVLLGLAALAWVLVAGGAPPGWTFWEQLGQRLTLTLGLLSPLPALFGLSAPAAWEAFSRSTLGVSTPAWLSGVVYSLAYLGLAAFLVEVSTRGFHTLAADPDRLRVRPKRTQEATEDGKGREFYWQGFRNPVWTRDIRTRLRNKETIEFIFFASVAVAAGGFIPLVLNAGDLSDPLQMAETSRNVFFWLTMTLVALVTLITPGMTADALTLERSKGTLELLIASTLRPKDILMGKLLGAVSVMLLLISPSLPLFGLCYLFHGASTAQVLQVYLLLTVTLTLAAVIGLTQSTINKKSGMAKFLAYAITAVLVAFPGGPFWIAAAVSAPDAQARQSLQSLGGVTAVVSILWAFVLLLLWGHAREELEYLEH